MAKFQIEVERKMHSVLRDLCSHWETKLELTTERVLMRGLLAEYEAGTIPGELLGQVRGTALPPPGYMAPEVNLPPDVVEAEATEVEVEFEWQEWWVPGPITCPGIVVIGEGTNLFIQQTSPEVMYVRVMVDMQTEGKPIRGTQTTRLDGEDTVRTLEWLAKVAPRKEAVDVGRVWRHPDPCPGGYPLAQGDWAFVVNKGRHYDLMVYDEDGHLIHAESLSQAHVQAYGLQGTTKRDNEVPLTFASTRHEFVDHAQHFVRDINLSERYADKEMTECQVEIRDALRALQKYPSVATEALIANGICTGRDGWVEFKCGGQRFGVRGDRVARINETAGSSLMNPSNIIHPQDMQLILMALEQDREKWERWGSKAPRMLRDRVGEGLYNRNPFWLWIEPALDHWRVEFDLDLDLWERIRRKLMRSHTNKGFYEIETFEFLGNYKNEPENPQRAHSMEFITEVLRLHHESIESREYRLSRSMADYLSWLRSAYR